MYKTYDNIRFFSSLQYIFTIDSAHLLGVWAINCPALEVRDEKKLKTTVR